MSDASDFFEDLILSDLLISGPAFLALSTTDPLETGAGIAEPVGGGYARIDLTGLFAIVGGGSGQASNVANVDSAVASASWGTISHVAIFDAASGGNMKARRALVSPVAIGVNQIFRIPVGLFLATVA